MSTVTYKVVSSLNIPQTIQKIDNDTFWKFAATEWWRLITPWTPRRKGALFQTVTIRPKSITYEVPYAARMYFNNYNFRTDKHAFATSHWDDAAKAAGQEDKLINSLNNYINTRGLLK